MLFNQRIFSRNHRSLNDRILLIFIQTFKTKTIFLSLLINTCERKVLNFLNNETLKINSHTHPTSISIDKYEQADAMMTVLFSLRIPIRIHG